jgi:hypothetical protein
MPSDLTEPDWKLFRQVRPIALERFCQRVLSEVGQPASGSGGSSHERYLALFEVVQRRDKDLAEAFDAPRRSTALRQLAQIRFRDLLSDEEFARFSPEAREAVRGWLELWRS